MNKRIGKFISIFFLIIFFLGSGAGQLIHAAFHDHNYTLEINAGKTTINTPHSFCIALQLTLPEFFGSGTCIIKSICISQDHFFADFEPAIPHLFSIKNSDRAQNTVF
ncbi:MAG: hypothetical protein ABI405_04880 [Parafilimonas sp.]